MLSSTHNCSLVEKQYKGRWRISLESYWQCPKFTSNSHCLLLKQKETLTIRIYILFLSNKPQAYPYVNIKNKNQWSVSSVLWWKPSKLIWSLSKVSWKFWLEVIKIRSCIEFLIYTKFNIKLAFRLITVKHKSLDFKLNL